MFFLNLLKVGISFVSIGAHNFILDMKSLSLPEKEIFFSIRGNLPSNENDPVSINSE